MEIERIKRLIEENPEGIKFYDAKDHWIKVVYLHKDRVSYITDFGELSSMGIEVIKDHWGIGSHVQRGK